MIKLMKQTDLRINRGKFIKADNFKDSLKNYLVERICPLSSKVYLKFI